MVQVLKQFGVSLGSVWVTFVLLWCHFGVSLGYFDVTWGSLWGHFGITLGSLWDNFGVTLGALSRLQRRLQRNAISYIIFVSKIGKDWLREGFFLRRTNPKDSTSDAKYNIGNVTHDAPWVFVMHHAYSWRFMSAHEAS